VRTATVLLALLLASCGSSSDDVDAGGGSDASTPPPGTDAGDPSGDGGVPTGVDAGDGVEVVDVSHDREVRGVWIATVYNINWPSRSGLSADAQRAELDALLDVAADAGMNSVFMQVRAESDAFYASELEPWSRFLTGTSGGDPGWDPLAHAIDAAHARGLELHAWMNPYRALVSGGPSTAASSHIVNARPELVVRYGDLHWIDPGNPDGRAHTLAVIRDVLERYDIDGLHFDDYFYPYPESGVAFPDDASYAAHGDGLARDDWRRRNVNEMVAAVHALVREVAPDVRFGISPFGIYRPGMPAGIRGLDQYAALFADPIAWMEAGTVDYIAPQLYWPTTRAAQDYALLLDWWAAEADATGVDLLVGNYLAQLGSSSEWPLSEIRTQLELVRADDRAAGNIQYHIDPIVEDRMGAADLLRGHHAVPATTPPIPGATDGPGLPGVTVTGADVALAGDGRCFAIYRDEGGAWIIDRLVFGDATRLYRGRWAVSLVARNGLESRGVVIDVEEGDPTDPPVDPPMGAGCDHSFGGRYAHTACSASYQCCDGAWQMLPGGCGACLCVEESGMTGCP